MAADFSGGRGNLGPPRDRVLAATLDAHLNVYANRSGWHPLRVTKVRSGLRLLLAIQDTPGAAIARSELAVLSHFFITQRHVAAVLADAGMLIDDRIPAVRRWFDQQMSGVPQPMAAELQTWFEVMHAGSATTPRRPSRPTGATEPPRQEPTVNSRP